MHQNGAVSDFEGGVRLSHSDRRDLFEPFGSSFRPNWRESGAQLTEKQAVLLMHDIYLDVGIYQALEDYSGEESDEVSYSKGEELQVVEANLDGWWKVRT